MKITLDALKVTVEFGTPFPFPEEEWGKLLQERAFTKPTDGEAVISVSPDGTQIPSYRWMHEGVESQYQPTLGRISAEGRDYGVVAKAFDAMLTAVGALKPPISLTETHWTELILNLRGYGKPAPLAAFEAVGASKAGEILSQAFGEKMMPFQLVFFSSPERAANRPLNTVENWTNVTFSPLGPNPSIYAVRYVLRRKDSKEVLEKLRRLEETFQRAFEGLGIHDG